MMAPEKVALAGWGILILIAGCTAPQPLDPEVWDALEPGLSVEFRDRSHTLTLTYLGQIHHGGQPLEAFSIGPGSQEVVLLDSEKTIVAKIQVNADGVVTSFPRWTPTHQGEQLPFVGLEVVHDGAIRLGTMEIPATRVHIDVEAPFESRNFATGVQHEFDGRISVEFGPSLPFPHVATGFGHDYRLVRSEQGPVPARMEISPWPTSSWPQQSWSGELFPSRENLDFPLGQAHEDLKRLSSEYRAFSGQAGVIMCRAEYRSSGTLAPSGVAHSWKIRLCSSDGKTGEATVFRNSILLNQSQLDGNFIRGVHARQSWAATPHELVHFDELLPLVLEQTGTLPRQWAILLDATSNTSEAFAFQGDQTAFAKDAVTIRFMPEPTLEAPVYVFSGYDGKLLLMIEPP